MKRFFLVLAVAAAMVTVTAMPVLAQDRAEVSNVTEPGETVSQTVSTPSGTNLATGGDFVPEENLLGGALSTDAGLQLAGGTETGLDACPEHNLRTPSGQIISTGPDPC